MKYAGITPKPGEKRFFTERDKTMKFGKKLLAAVLAAVLALTVLTACDGNATGNVDLAKSKEIQTVINEKRTANGKSELKLSEEASQQLGAWAQAAATQNANPTKDNVAATTSAKSAAKSRVKALTIDGKKVIKTWETYAIPGATANDVKTAMTNHPEWFLHVTEDECNYVAIATYGSGDAAATVILMMLVK